MENLQNSMDECQMRWNVSDVCEWTSSSGSYIVPLLRSLDGEHDEHLAVQTQHNPVAGNSFNKSNLLMSFFQATVQRFKYHLKTTVTKDC